MVNLTSYPTKGAPQFRFGSKVPSEAALQLDDIRETWRLGNRVAIAIRPARSDDGPMMQALVHGLSLRSRYNRFFYAANELSPDTLIRFTHADPMHEVTLLAVIEEGGREVAVGMAQYVVDTFPERCEFAVVVADAWQRKGLGFRLISNLICIARAAGLERIDGDILADNEPMRQLLMQMGFTIGHHPDEVYLRRASKPLVQPTWKCSPLTALVTRMHAGG